MTKLCCLLLGARIIVERQSGSQSASQRKVNWAALIASASPPWPVSNCSDGALGSLGSIIYASISILPPACLARCVRALTVVDGSATRFDVFDGFQAKHVSGMHKPYGHRTGSEDH